MSTETPEEAAQRLSADVRRAGYRLDALHVYRGEDGSALYFRIRCKHASGKKWIRPMRFEGAVYELGEPPFPDGKPLYGLDRLFADRNAMVYIVEGEKCVDVLAGLGLVAITSGSCSSDASADWSPMHDRTCVIWPDNDAPGAGYATRVARRLQVINCNVALVDPSIVHALPIGGDVIDWLADHAGATGADIYALTTVAPHPPQHVTIEPDANDLPKLPAPQVSPEMYYGLVGDVMRAASNETEVHPAAAGLAFMCFAGVALGRACYIHIGDDKHHPRLFTVHVGRSSVAGKGMAVTLVRRIRDVLEHDAAPNEPVTGNFHDGGLSSREGLTWLIRDPSDELDDEGRVMDRGVADKRLLVVEEEFANVLRQSRRDGNTLSSALRTAWDGHDLAPATKNNRITASCPHIGIHACITPSELLGALTARELTNGFANRFLFCWAERQGIVPYPAPTPTEVVRKLAGSLAAAIQYAQTAGEVSASDDAKQCFATFYRRHRRGLGYSAAVRGLLERHPPYAWRVALIFALLDQAPCITDAHMNAALAWLAYCTESTRLIFSTARDEADASTASTLAKRITDTLDHAPGKSLEREALRVALGKPDKKLLNAALEQLDLAGAVEEISVPREGGGWPLRKYVLKEAPRLERLARLDPNTDSSRPTDSPRVDASREPGQAAMAKSP